MNVKYASPLPTDEDSSENGSANGLPAQTLPEVLAGGGATVEGGASYREVAENGLNAPLDFSTSLSSSLEEQQPINLSDRIPNAYVSDTNRKFPVKTEYASKVCRQD